MGNIFGFFEDMDNHNERCVGRYPKEGDFVVDTARVSDGREPYETAVQHPKYDDGSMVIVEAYPTKAKAVVGHKKWVKKMTSKKLPEVLRDCQNAEVAQLIPISELVFPRQD